MREETRDEYFTRLNELIKEFKKGDVITITAETFDEFSCVIPKKRYCTRANRKAARREVVLGRKEDGKYLFKLLSYQLTAFPAK
ncbi:MAG TPA: hypothetical protein PK951_11320 [Chitinophagaceae bacterium]|nr:hypothetical protein [Chitinophagaceae bacterium]HUM64317.1 hypothetical protein [Chitinophagaceae bacterium]